MCMCVMCQMPHLFSSGRYSVPSKQSWLAVSWLHCCLPVRVCVQGLHLDSNQLTWTTPHTNTAVPGELGRGRGEVGGVKDKRANDQCIQ